MSYQYWCPSQDAGIEMPASAIEESEMVTVETSIFLNASRVKDHGNGLFEVVFLAQELPPEILAVIRERFPHTMEEVFAALDKENVLATIVSRENAQSTIEYAARQQSIKDEFTEEFSRGKKK